MTTNDPPQWWYEEVERHLDRIASALEEMNEDG